MEVLGEVEVRHSRSGAPTRRVGLGRLGIGQNDAVDAVLLAAMAASGAAVADEHDVEACEAVLALVRDGVRVAQPRVRHRYQVDHHGLASSVVRLLGDEAAGEIDVQVDGSASGVQLMLGAVYAAERFEERRREKLCDAIAFGLRWRGVIDERFAARVAGGRVTRDAVWAARVLGVLPGASRTDVARRFRALVRSVHPDAGGDASVAAQRIGELEAARRVLTGR